MVRRGGCLFCLIVLATSAVGSIARAGGPATHASSAERKIVFTGYGAGHGLGMAMDGVEGEARAGWTHDRILSLFYPQTTSGRASGVIRIGLASVPATDLTLPSGGVVSDAPRGAKAGAGFPVALPPGAHVGVRLSGDGVALALPPVPKPQAKPTPTPAGEAAAKKKIGVAHVGGAAGPRLLPTPPPVLVPSPPPSPRTTKKPPPVTSTPRAAVRRGVLDRAWIWGTGDPAVVGVGATTRRYRGSIEIARRPGALSVINHVDLETYVAGIAEEKGAGWPIEALKTLAIAARSLGAATLGWMDGNHDDGYDICPTDSCQVYLGYDGEEPEMRRAAAETAGVIRTFGGRPILAMYHGNGGGQTESYDKLTADGSNPYPYLASIRYPFADPHKWKVETTYAAVESSLRSSEIAIAGSLQHVDIVERGDSPRVLRVRLRGTNGDTTVSGARFATAIDLPTTWFDIGPKPYVGGAVFRGDGGIDTGVPLLAGTAPRSQGTERSWIALMVAVLALVVLAAATNELLAKQAELGPVAVSGALLYGSDTAG